MQSSPDSEVQKNDISSDKRHPIYSLGAKEECLQGKWKYFVMWHAPALPFTYQIFGNVMLKVIITFGIKRRKS